MMPPKNVLLLGIAFMLLFTAYNTAQNLVTSELPAGLGFISLCIVYGVIAIGKPLAPLIVERLKEKTSMFISAFCYAVYVASLIKVLPVAVYISSVVLGLGASVLWVAQGSYLTMNSTKETRGQNAGVFWAIFQLSGIIGNVAVFLVNKFTTWEFSYEAIGLTAFAVFGWLFLLSLGAPPTASDIEKTESINTPLLDEKQQAHKLPIDETTTALPTSTVMKDSAWRILVDLLKQPNCWLLLAYNFFVGQEMSYNVGGFPTRLQMESIGLTMALYGLAETLGAYAWGKLTDSIDRRIVILIATVLYGVAMYLSCIITNNWLQYIVAFLFGLADSCFNVLYIATIAIAFEPRYHVTCFSIFQWMQAIGSCVGFFMGAQYPVQVSWKMINRSIGFKYIMIQQSMVIVVVVSSLGAVGVGSYFFVRPINK